MHRDEQVRLLLIGDGGARFKRDEGVVVARVDDVGTEAVLKQLAEAKRDVENEIFFVQAVRADGTGVMPAMTGVNDDASDFEAQRADQQTVAVHGGLRGASVDLVRRLLLLLDARL